MNDHRLAAGVVVERGLIDELAAICPTASDPASTTAASRDWWPLAMNWAEQGLAVTPPAAVCSPATTAEVAAIVRVCAGHQLPVTVSAGRSGVCGAAMPVRGGIVVDTTRLRGVVAVDAISGLLRARAGTFGPELEAAANAHGMTVGHFPQSFEISTVGGWVACRGAGQFSTRYGKIERMVAGLEVVLADGSVLATGNGPAGASGIDLTEVFVGSEGTLGVITEVTLRGHPQPPVRRTAAYRLTSFDEGIEVCRGALRRGATPAVLRLYDADETSRSHGGDGSWCALLVLDEGDEAIVAATMSVVADEARRVGAVAISERLVDGWLEHRNDVSALGALIGKGFVVDTMEIAAPWAALPRLFDDVRGALRAVPHCVAASCHLSHSYLDGACLYFTFAARPPAAEIETTYVALWDAAQRAALRGGSNLSHHHGIGINRARFVAEHLGDAFQVAAKIKAALDPDGILNPAKLGYPSKFGQAEWP